MRGRIGLLRDNLLPPYRIKNDILPPLNEFNIKDLVEI